MYLNNPNRRVIYWLYIFFLCGKFKSIKAAADHMDCHIATLSEGMTNLEYYLGVRLRVPRTVGFKLTPAGERLYNRLRYSFENIEMVMKDLDAFNELYTEAGIEKCSPKIVQLYTQEVVLPRGEKVKATMLDDLVALMRAVDFWHRYPARGAQKAKTLSQKIESRLSQDTREELERVRSSEAPSVA